jgi:hypothetical protein
MRYLDRWRRRHDNEDKDEHDEATQHLLERARALPHESEPGRDLWSGIENRIRAESLPQEVSPSVGAPLLGVFPRPALTTLLGIVLVATTAIVTLWLGEPSLPVLPTTDSELRSLANELRDRDGIDALHESLLAILEESHSDLPVEARLALEENLRRIDHALAELNLALRQHPEHPELRFLLAETYRREADLLERMQTWVEITSGAKS